MNSVLAWYIANTTLGQLQEFSNIGLVPIFNCYDRGPDHLMLDEALVQHQLTVTEVNDDATGPALNLRNWAAKPVLALAGEKLCGGTYTRILERSILLPPNGELRVPKCDPRHGPVRSSLLQVGLCCPIPRQSPTEGLSVEETQACLRAFAPSPGQRGLMVTMGPEIVGLEILGNEHAYKYFHQKVLATFLAAVRVEARRFGDNEFFDEALRFFHSIADCDETQCAPIGCGTDFQFESQDVSGTALMLGERVIHLSLFASASDSRGSGEVGAQDNSSSVQCAIQRAAKQLIPIRFEIARPFSPRLMGLEQTVLARRLGSFVNPRGVAIVSGPAATQ
jgi:hypothetical protein